MLAALKRLFIGVGRSAVQAPRIDSTEAAGWARRRGHGFKHSRDGDGFVIDGLLDGKPWRLEWGPPHRAYISGHELRLRMELPLPSGLQMLLLSRPLMASLERATYEQFTEGTQTQIGTATPEEMRWLVMFPKVDFAGLPALRSRFGAVASTPAAGLAWIDGPLAHALERAAAGALSDDPPFVLMTLRNRVYLRLQLAAPDPAAIATALELFEVGVAQAVRCGTAQVDPGAEWTSTASSAWQSLKPDDLGDPGRERRRR